MLKTLRLFWVCLFKYFMFNAIIPNFLPALAEIMMAIFCLFGIILASFKKKNAQKLLFFVGKVSLIICLSIIILKPSVEQITFNGLFSSDQFTKTTQIIILLNCLFCLIFATHSATTENLQDHEYPLLFLFATLGMLTMVTSNDLMGIFVSVELLSLCLYVFVALNRHNIYSNEAALKYFILGALSTGIFLYGISLIYGFMGTTNLEVLQRLLKGDLQYVEHTHMAIICALLFIIVGLAFKIAMAPFHMWLPDVYQGSPTSITMFLATAPKIAAFAVFVRVLLGPFRVLWITWYPVIFVFCILSMVFGSMGALVQTNLRRILAYSSIGHMGFAMIGIYTGSEYGIQSSITYVVIYSLMTLSLFGSLIHLNICGIRTENLCDLRGIGKTFPIAAFVCAFSIFSLAGIPPLPGFLTKVFILQTAISVKAYTLTTIAILYSVVAAGYYLIIIKAMFFDSPSKTTLAYFSSIKKQPKITLLALYILIIGMMVVFIAPNRIVHWASQSATAVLFDK